MKKVNSLEIDRIRSKWEPVILKKSNIKNKSITDIICLYCEWYASDIDSSDLADRLLDIFSKVDSYSRVEIIGKFVNIASGNIEYKLSNDKFIPVSGVVEYELDIKDKIEIFGQDFIKDLDLKEFRDNKLYSILK